MPYFPVDDQFTFHPKAVAAGNTAIGVWTRAGAWCKNHASGGRIPFDVAHAIGSKKIAEKLVAVGLWHLVPDYGYEFHDWQHQAGNGDAATEKRRRDQEAEANRRRQQEYRNRKRGSNGPANGADNATDNEAGNRESNGVTNALSNAPVTEPPSPSPINQDSYTSSYVPERESFPQGPDEGESVEAICIRQAALLGVDFGKVKAAIEQRCGRFAEPTDVVRVIATVLDRASRPIKSPTGAVLASVANDWAEWQQLIDEAPVSA